MPSGSHCSPTACYTPIKSIKALGTRILLICNFPIHFNHKHNHVQESSAEEVQCIRTENENAVVDQNVFSDSAWNLKIVIHHFWDQNS